MKHFTLKKYFSILAILIPFSAVADDVVNSDWQIDIAPYIWAISLNGTVTNGPLTAHIDESSGELIHHFDSGGMLWIDAYKDRFGIFLNGLYVDLSDHDSIDEANLSARSHYGLISGGLSYLLSQNETQFGYIKLEPYAGARYTVNNVSLKLDQISTLKTNQSWTDPIIGLRIKDQFNKRLYLTLAGDIGGTDKDKQDSFNLIALLGYQPDCKALSTATLYLGYRYLYQNYEHGAGEGLFEWKMHLYGPVAGINFHLS